MEADDYKRLPPRYDGTAEEVAPDPIGMPNAMTVEGYIAGLGKMASASLKPGKGHAAARIAITVLVVSTIGGLILGFLHTAGTAFGQ